MLTAEQNQLVSMPTEKMSFGRFSFPSGSPLVMGVLNVTPDSFSDGSLFIETDQAIKRAESMIEQGVHIIDIGGESTRPGAQYVPVETELSRILPILKALINCGVPLSVDTRRTEIMRVVLDLGVDIINDVSGFRDVGAPELVSQYNCGLCVMHMQGDPSNMQDDPRYYDVVQEVREFLSERTDCLLKAGVSRERIVVDPGIGFGKTHEHNLCLISCLERIVDLNFPVLMGVSRKKLLGLITGKSVHERMVAGVSAALYSISKGATIIRTHDVSEMQDAVKVWFAIQSLKKT